MNSKYIKTKSTFFSNKMNRSVELFPSSAPFQEVLPLKFPQKLIRKPCDATMLTESIYNPQRLCIKTYAHANKSHIYDTPSTRNLSKPGLYAHLGNQTQDHNIHIRSYEDFGAYRNQKKTIPLRKLDPIIEGQITLYRNSSLQKAWKEPRRHRDNGVELSNTLVWKIPGKKEKLKNMSGIYGANTTKKDVEQAINAKKAAKSYKQLHLCSKNLKSLLK